MASMRMATKSKNWDLNVSIINKSAQFYARYLYIRHLPYMHLLETPIKAYMYIAIHSIGYQFLSC